MASRTLLAPFRIAISTSILPRAPNHSRFFQTSHKLLQDAAATSTPVKKPVGAFRGGLFGFFFGATTAGGAMYYYVVEEYRVTNELLTEDIYALQAAVQRIEAYVRELEAKVDTATRKK